MSITVEPNVGSFVLRGAQLVDGTGSPSRRADVRVDGDRITAVGDVARETGLAEVDLGGLTLAPGFIDIHRAERVHNRVERFDTGEKVLDDLRWRQLAVDDQLTDAPTRQPGQRSIVIASNSSRRHRRVTLRRSAASVLQ